MNKKSRIYIAGHKGMVGSAICQRLERAGYSNLLVRSRSELDLTNQSAVDEFFRIEKPDAVYLAAAKVGGIYANSTYPAEFIYENLAIECNVINAAFNHGASRLLFLGSSCIYPRCAPQPIKEEALLQGELEPTNEPYAIAKIAGIKLCESYNRQYGCDFRSVMPTNLYGPGDNFHPENSHVIPALMRRFHEAGKAGDAEVEIWGTGRPRREFLHVRDMASACVHVMGLARSAYQSCTHEMLSHINVGTGDDISISELAYLIADVVGFTGGVTFNPKMPDGTPRKLLDVSRINQLGWEASINLKQGLEETYAWFLESQSEADLRL